MKKIITSILALSLTAALFMGCEQTDNSGGNAVVEVETSESETVNETTQESTDSTTASETADTSYEDVIRAFYDAANGADYETLLKTIYPAKIAECMPGLIDLDREGFDSRFGVSSSTYEITDIIEEEPMDQRDLDNNVKILNNIADSLDILRENGGDAKALSDEELKKIFDAIIGEVNPNATDIPDYYSSSKGYNVTVRYNKDGKSNEDYFIVVYVDGEGWKVNNSMREYAHKTKNASLNDAAKSIYKAFNTALTETVDEGITLDGLFIIGSDDSMNYNVPSTVNTSEILKKADRFFNEIDDYDYFIIVKNGYCIYSAADKKDDDDTIGTNPIDEIPVSLSTIDGEKFEIVDTVSADYYSFEELFEAAKNAIN